MSDTEKGLVIKVENGEAVGFPLTYSNLKFLFPEQVFFYAPDREQVESLGYGIFYISEKPSVPSSHVNQDGYVFNELNGAWTYKWQIVPFTQEELELEQQQQLEELWSTFRAHRNAKLAISDWTQGADSPLSSEKKAEWAAYRQALRDLPSTVDIENVVWPLPPA